MDFIIINNIRCKEFAYEKIQINCRMVISYPVIS